MDFDSKDIEAVAKARVSRAESKKMNYYIYGIVAAFVIGIICLRIENYGIYIGYGVIIFGVIAFLRFMQSVSRKQRVAAFQLKKEWRAEIGSKKEEQS